MTCQMVVEVDPGLFREPFRIAGHTFAGLPAVRVTLWAADGLCGRGEAAGVYFLGDDLAHVRAEIERVRGPVEAGIGREDLQTLLPPGGARNALDAAMWELAARRERRPVWSLAGLPYPGPRVTTFTLSADNPASLRRNLTRYAQARALKLKFDGNRAADIDRLRIVHEERPDAWLMVDANQGYAVDALADLLPELVACNVRLLEQPVARGAEAGLEGLASPIPLIADESILCAADLPAMVGRFQGINIKLDKCGGLTEAIRMARAARRQGLMVMVGNMGGSSLAAAPAYLLAQICDVVDLDGPSFLAADLPGGVRYAGGMVGLDENFWGAAVAAALL